MGLSASGVSKRSASGPRTGEKLPKEVDVVFVFIFKSVLRQCCFKESHAERSYLIQSQDLSIPCERPGVLVTASNLPLPPFFF